MRSSDTAFERGMRRTAQAVAATLGKVNGKVILLSDEDILCYNAFGSTTIWRNIDRVCRLFQDPLVRGVSLSLVLTIRRQDHLIPSFCAQYHVLEAERVDWAEFIDRRLRCPEYGLFGTLFFHKVVDYCIQHVGYDNVHVLLFGGCPKIRDFQRPYYTELCLGTSVQFLASCSLNPCRKIGRFGLLRVISLVCRDSNPEKWLADHFFVLQAACLWRCCASRANIFAISHRL